MLVLDLMAGRRTQKTSGWRSVAATIGAVGLVVVAAGLASLPVASEGIRRAAAAGSSGPLGVANSAAVAASASASSSTSSAKAVASSAPPPPLVAIGKGTRVLVFGDSFVAAGFEQHLATLVQERGGVFFWDSWTSSSTSSWDKSSRLAALLLKAKPDVVIIALGANEVFMPSPEALSSHVRNIVARLGTSSCVWSSPPLWKGETGIVKVERDNSAPCLFFDPGVVQIPRNKDGIHPSNKGGEIWSDALWGATILPGPAIAAASASSSASASAAPSGASTAPSSAASAIAGK